MILRIVRRTSRSFLAKSCGSMWMPPTAGPRFSRMVFEIHGGFHSIGSLDNFMLATSDKTLERKSISLHREATTAGAFGKAPSAPASVPRRARRPVSLPRLPTTSIPGPTDDAPSSEAMCTAARRPACLMAHISTEICARAKFSC